MLVYSVLKPVIFKYSEDLAKEIARIATQSLNLGYQLEKVYEPADNCYVSKVLKTL